MPEFAVAVADFKPLKLFIDSAEHVFHSFVWALLHDEWVNPLRQPLEWKACMVKPVSAFEDKRLHKWAQQVRLVVRSNYDQAASFLAQQTGKSAFFCLDLETTTPDESDEWLALRTTKGGGVDVIASTIVGCGLTFGRNQQYGFYCSVDHAGTDNISLDQLQGLLELIPHDKMTVAHNAAGFEIPVLFNAFGQKWASNGWRGMFPNMVDSRIAASYWDENQPSHGLKQLSAKLLDYQQQTYEEVTEGTKTDDITAHHVMP